MHFLANLELTEEKPNRAIPYLNDAKRIIDQGGRTEQLVKYYDLMHGAYKLKGNYKKGLEYYQNMSMLRDSIGVKR